MMAHNTYLYIAVIAITCYLIRVLPLTLIRKPITNAFVQSFLYHHAPPFSSRSARLLSLGRTEGLFPRLKTPKNLSNPHKHWV